jgi:hypothetical protein
MTGLSAHRQKDVTPTNGWVTLGILTRWVRNPTRKVRLGTHASIHPTYFLRDAVTEGGSTGGGFDLLQPPRNPRGMFVGT